MFLIFDYRKKSVKTGDPVDGQASQEIRLFRLAYCAHEKPLQLDLLVFIV